MRLIMPYYYKDVYDLFKWFLDRYWPGLEIHDFHNHTPVGWTDKIIEYFGTINDEYVIMTPEDFFLIEPVNLKSIESCKRFINAYKPDKLELTGVYETAAKEGEVITMDELYFSEVAQGIDYRASLHPSIWKREYFLRVAHKGQAWWKFENATKARNDGAHIYSVIPPPIGKLVNFMWRGRANTRVFHQIEKQDELEKVNELARRYK